MTPTRAFPTAGADGARLWAELSRDLIAATDALGTIQWANAAFRQTTGLDAGDTLGDLSGPDVQDLAEIIAAGLQARQTPDRHCRVQAADDRVRWLRARVSVTDAVWLWTFADETTLQHLEDEGILLSDQLDAAQEFGRLGVWERHIATGTGHWDPRLFDLFGLDASGPTPTHEQMRARIHPDDEKPVFVESTRKTGRYLSRFRILRPDGALRRVRSQWEVMSDNDGKPERVIGVMVDETRDAEFPRALDGTAQLSLAIELSGVALWRFDHDTRRLHANRHGFDLLGMPYQADGLRPHAVMRLVHPQDRHLLTDPQVQALNDTPVDQELRVRHADGSWRHMLLRRVAEHSAAGLWGAHVGVALDITPQIAQARQADRLRRLLETATRSAGVGIWTCAVGSTAGDWNAEMYTLLDVDPTDGAPPFHTWIAERVHAEDQTRLTAHLNTFLRGQPGRPEIEFRVVLRQGQLRRMTMRADVAKSGGEGLRVFGIVMDVTERHEAQEALRTANERSALIARHAGIGTWESNADGSAAVWDEQMYWLRGLDPRVTKLSWDERMALLHPDDRARVLESHPRLEDDAQPRSYEFRVRWPDGSEHWLASRSAVWRDADGRVGKRVGVNWDITEAKAAEATRQQALLTERASQAKSQFLSRMSHELRTPLNAVLGFTQLLQLEGGARASEKLGHIRQAGEHLLRLIDDALDLSALEAGKLKLEPQEVGVAQAVRQALGLVTQMAQERGVALREAGLEGRVWADPTRLRQVLLNLLSNGIKYNRPAGEVWVSAREAGDWVGLEVGDTGLGMTPEQLAHLFEPFNRLGRHQAGIQGSGIGLTVVKGLVENMGGHIEVRSQPQHGTVFSLRLPRGARASAGQRMADEGAQSSALTSDATPTATPAPAPAAAAASSTAPSPCRGRLLYIEDNEVNVLLVEELVRTQDGIEIVSEGTGAAGVARAIELRPDVVLIDMQLPDFDGFEVLRRLRAHPATEKTPCIALSANAMPLDIARALSEGFADYWTKPIGFGPFLAALNRMFPPTTTG